MHKEKTSNNPVACNACGCDEFTERSQGEDRVRIRRDDVGISTELVCQGEHEFTYWCEGCGEEFTG